ncbi:MAG: type VI secretion system tip protein TssI/VgrG [Polyangiaceae bacterium]
MASTVAGAATPHSARLESEEIALDDLVIAEFDGEEETSRPFRFDIVLRPVDPRNPTTHDPSEMVGAGVSLVLSDREGLEIRRIQGEIRQARVSVDGSARAGGAGNRPSALYRLEVVPRLKRLDLLKTQEIFMNMSIPEIITDKIGRMGLDYLVLRLAGTYPKREFVVQYKESDLAFVMRLAEHVGLSFHFEQGQEHEQLVITDQVSSTLDLRNQPAQFGPREDRAHVHELSLQCQTAPAVFAVQDYNYRHPRLDLGVYHELESGSGGVIEYGTHHKTPEEAEHLARVRAEESLAARRVFEGEGITGFFTAGARIKVEEAPLGPGEMLLTRVRHHMRTTAGGLAEGEVGYQNSFSAVTTERPYRPVRATPKPRIDGVLTGIVQADPTSQGLEAKLDDEGRYVVQFHFDTTDRGQTKTSRPVRMAQPFAGPNQGMHFPLTPDTEVVIAFVDGDPDRPIIIGAVPNTVTPTTVTAADAHMHRVQSRHGILVEFGRLVRS